MFLNIFDEGNLRKAFNTHGFYKILSSFKFIRNRVVMIFFICCLLNFFFKRKKTTFDKRSLETKLMYFFQPSSRVLVWNLPSCRLRAITHIRSRHNVYNMHTEVRLFLSCVPWSSVLNVQRFLNNFTPMLYIYNCSIIDCFCRQSWSSNTFLTRYPIYDCSPF